MINKPQQWRIELVVQRLLAGDVIAYPAEGVWGLGCLPDSEQAVAKILALKQRSWEQGLILVAGRIGHFDAWLTDITDAERRLLREAWPGPVTFIVPDNGTTPLWIRGSHDSVALRVSAHPVVAAICNQLDGPMVSTSANPSGRQPARSALRLRQYFPAGIDYIVPGQIGDSPGPTEIRTLRNGAALRDAGAGPTP